MARRILGSLFGRLNSAVGLQNKYDEQKINFLVLLQNKQNCAIFAPYAKKQAHAKPHKAEGEKKSTESASDRACWRVFRVLPTCLYVS
jgi:hypothetical protein